MMRNVSKLLKMDLRSHELFLNLPPLYCTSEYHWAMWRLIQKTKYIWCVYLFWNNTPALLFYSTQLLLYYPTCTWILLYKEVNASANDIWRVQTCFESFFFSNLRTRKVLVFFKKCIFSEFTSIWLKLWSPPALMSSGWMNRLLLRPLVLREEDHNQTTWTSLPVSLKF